MTLWWLSAVTPVGQEDRRWGLNPSRRSFFVRVGAKALNVKLPCALPDWRWPL